MFLGHAWGRCNFPCSVVIVGLLLCVLVVVLVAVGSGMNLGFGVGLNGLVCGWCLCS